MFILGRSCRQKKKSRSDEQNYNPVSIAMAQSPNSPHNKSMTQSPNSAHNKSMTQSPNSARTHNNQYTSNLDGLRI